MLTTLSLMPYSFFPNEREIWNFHMLKKPFSKKLVVYSYASVTLNNSKEKFKMLGRKAQRELITRGKSYESLVRAASRM